jgi:hypothetical protein
MSAETTTMPSARTFAFYFFSFSQPKAEGTS